MPSLNKTMTMGNLTRDPTLRYTPKGVGVLELCLAVNRTWTDDGGNKHETATFINATFFGKPAEILNQYCKKGDPLYVEGRLEHDEWEDKKTGQKRSRLKIVGEQFQFLGSKRQ